MKIMGVSSNEEVKLMAYQVKGVAKVSYDKQVVEGGEDVNPIEKSTFKTNQIILGATIGRG